MSEQCALGPDCPVHLGKPCEHRVTTCVHCMQTVYPAAGPWHKWPESAPPTAKGCYLVRTANGGMDALLWVPGCPEFWMDDPPVTDWAEILPPSEP